MAPRQISGAPKRPGFDAAKAPPTYQKSHRIPEGLRDGLGSELNTIYSDCIEVAQVGAKNEGHRGPLDACSSRLRQPAA